MKDVSNEERWQVMLVQARRFAEKESYVDAVARARLVRDQMREARRQARGADEVARLERSLVPVERELTGYEQQNTAWRERITALARARREGAEEEMRRPLPKPP